MSWLGIDLAGNACFVSGDGSWEIEQVEGEENEEDVTAPPPVTEVDTGADTDEVSSYGGITILSSAPSSTDPLRGASASAGSITPDDGNASHTQLSEVDTTFSRLSLHPSLVNSSIMTQSSLSIPRTVSVDSSDDDDDDDDDDDEDDDDKMEALPTSQAERTQEPSSQEDNILEDQLKVWYGRLETDQDWDDFRDSVMEVLKAIDSSSLSTSTDSNNQDELISQLIRAEEEYFWDGPKQAEPVQRNWLLDAAAVAGTLAFATVAVVKILKGR